MWRRKSGTGAVDAQGLGLTHPMTWIDERLFGWSRSTKYGTSAWAGSSADEVGNPDSSDEEDAGDYENVLGFIPAYEGQLHPSQKPKSRQSSFADLQRLRLSPLPPSTPFTQARVYSSHHTTATSPGVDMDGLHFRDPPRERSRDGHRERRQSLSDRVPVIRIAELDREELFEQDTDNLNDEIIQRKTELARHD